MLVECTGMVGAGKTTVAAELKQLLAEAGHTALSPAEAAQRCLARSRLGRVSARLTPARWRQRLMRRLLRVVEVCYRLLFAVMHPQLVWHVLRSQRHREIPWWHRRIIVGLFFEVAGRCAFFRNRLQPGEVVVFEEGFLHRAINLYAWEPKDLDANVVARYFALLPALDLAVIVRAPLDRCMQRASARGLPVRLRDKSRRSIDRFMAHSEAIIGLAAQFLARQRREFVAIDNGGSLEDSLAQLRERLAASHLRTRSLRLDWGAPSAHPQKSEG